MGGEERFIKLGLVLHSLDGPLASNGGGGGGGGGAAGGRSGGGGTLGCLGGVR